MLTHKKQEQRDLQGDKYCQRGLGQEQAAQHGVRVLQTHQQHGFVKASLSYRCHGSVVVVDPDGGQQSRGSPNC